MKSTATTRTGLFSLLCALGLSQAATAPVFAASHDVDSMPSVSVVNGTKLRSPKVGDSTLNILSPDVLELVRVNGKPSANASVDSWDFVDASGNLRAPSASKFSVTVDGKAVAVKAVGFKRRPLYAPLNNRDLRVGNSLFLELAKSVPAGAKVVVKNPDGSLWPSSMKFTAEAHSLRYSPAVHVNQEGYVPSWPKKAAVGYYVGSLGELPIPNKRFELVDAATGDVVYSGSLQVRRDIGWNYSTAPYQKVYEADFSDFKSAGEYKLVVAGLGASLPFMIEEGVGMNFARTYAQGLYHQRCGHENALPFTRFTHEACHVDHAEVPTSASTYDFTWKTIANYANELNSGNPSQRAPRLTSPGSQLFPFVKKGKIDVSGGHHDAGDYSKYTTNAAMLLHLLMVGVDDFPGVDKLDNLGLPESGDGIGDLLQEAKIEADFIAKLQDTDGGFYFLVYPREREYESNVLPQNGDSQVVWPKTTSATAASVAALAQTGSSPAFKKAYPKAAAAYMEKAKLGWSFLEKAIAKHGKDGAYQKITHYGDDFTHDDELAWAAAAMFAATGDEKIHKTLKSWYDPADSATYRWGWQHAYSSYGNAARAYAFAARSGRLAKGKLDARYLAKTEAELIAAGDAALKWSQQSAYGTSFPAETKAVHSAGWYFSSAQAFDMTVAHQIKAKPAYLDAIVRNMNYEAGSNALNLSYITGLGWKRQNEIVHQYAQNDDRLLPVSGIPQGNLQTGPVYTGTYGTELAALTFPRDDHKSAPTPFYDRWSDTFNVATEFVHLDQARALSSLAYMAARTKTASQKWQSAAGSIKGVPSEIVKGESFKVRFNVPGMDLDEARITWEASGQQPAFGETYTVTPTGGAQWIEVEAHWPDGRRVYARKKLFSDNGLATVGVKATDAVATVGNENDKAVYTFTRTGDTKKALTVNFKLAGTAAKWTDYRRPQGDMPESITIPAGKDKVAMPLLAMAKSSGAKTATVVLSLEADSSYNLGKDKTGTVTLK